MNGLTLSWIAARASARIRWAALAPREQMWVGGAAAVVTLAVLWWVAVAPALRTLQHAETQRRTLDAQWATMQSLVAQAQTLKSQPVINRDDALRALESSVKQTLGATAQLSVVGDRATVTLRNTPADALAQWLAQARVNARALPSEARLARAGAPAPGAVASLPVAGDVVPSWSGSLVLSLPPQ